MHETACYVIPRFYDQALLYAMESLRAFRAPHSGALFSIQTQH